MPEDIIFREEYKEKDPDEILRLHANIYCYEHGYNEEFVDFVKDTLKNFNGPDPENERIWIVEKDRKVMGSVAVVRSSEDIAQIRWFILDPSLRDMGYGTLLFEKAVDFIREKGYSKAFLFTQSNLKRAARIYEKYGFRITEEEEMERWGRKLIGQRYEKTFP